ncbi:MAG: hypothetical protein J2P18_03780, partial [Nocardia sp.]|nr:hypothetical protein [Nocardia sp.]
MHRLSGAGTPPSQPPTDPDYAPTSEVFDHLTHTEIQRGVQQLNPEVLTAGQQTWQGSANSVADAVQAAHAEIRGAIADGWRGGAAQTAADAVAAFEKYGQHLSDVMAVVGQRLGQANGAAETLRSAVSQQGVEHANLEAALLDPSRATANVAVQKGAENLRQDAVRVMDTVYTGVFLAAGKDVPAFMDGGIYPDHPAPQAGPADPNAPGGGSSDLVGAASGSVPGGPEASAQAGPAASARATHDGHTGEHPGAGERQRT